jgi:hypothetical protein
MIRGLAIFVLPLVLLSAACSRNQQSDPVSEAESKALQTISASSVVMDSRALRISLLRNGAILINGKPLDDAAIDTQLDGSSATVFLYQEDHKPLTADTQARFDGVLGRLMKHGKAISVSSKPDFSDYVDANGVSRPRPTQ